MSQEPPPRPKARAPRGFADRRGGTLQAERTLLEAVARVYELYGFEPLETGALEYADALGKFLPDEDAPNQGVFALRDDDEQWMALRYDLTAPLARYVAENWESLPKPFRRYAFGPVWRDEKPGPGHGRQFMQCDADTVGSARPEADAEIIAMVVEACAAAGLRSDGIVVKINNRKLLNGLLSKAGVVSEAQKLTALRAGRKDESGAFTRGAGLDVRAIDAVRAFLAAGRPSRTATLDALAEVVGGSAEGEEGLGELRQLGEALAGVGLGQGLAVFDPSIVRGL
jgi:histidyl-tRNA synthetase